MGTVHIIGAGISGLAAASALAEKHVPVKLYEASSAAGGRCRSSSDAALGTIDHGVHIFSGASRELQRFITRIEAKDRFRALPGVYRLRDGLSGRTTRLRARCPLPALPLADLFMLGGHLLQPDGLRVRDMISGDSPLQDALNALSRMGLTQASHRAGARQLQQMVKRLLRRGGSKLYMARHSLQESFIAPALSYLEYHGSSVYFGMGLKQMDIGAHGPSSLNFTRKKLPLPEGDIVILATPAAVSKNILPQLAVPEATYPSITLHFTVDHREVPGSVLFLANAPMDLLRYEEGRMSAAIRLAEHAWHGDEDFLAARVWKAIQQQHPYLRGHALPAWASWREKRAGHVPADTALPPAALPPRVVLAGDWLDATRAASLECAAASGHAAAEAAFSMLDRKAPQSQYNFYLN